MYEIKAILLFDLSRGTSIENPTDQDIQKAKLLYYYPDDRNIDDKLSHLGLIEGLIALSRTFSDEKIEFIRSKLYITAILEWKPDIFLAAFFSNNTPSNNEKDEYSCYWRNDLLKAILKNSIKIFELLHGDLNKYVHPKDGTSNNNTLGLKPLFDEFLPTFMINSTSNALHLLKDIDGYKKCHANISVTLDAQMLIDEIFREFPAVYKTLLIYDDQIIHTTMELNVMLVVYSYLINHRGLLSKNKSLSVKWPEDSDLIIVDAQDDKLFNPRIYIDGNPYVMSILSTKKTILILLLDTGDPLLILNGIREYAANMPYGLCQLEEKIPKNAPPESVRLFTVNKISKNFNSIGYENLGGEKIMELAIIHDISSMIKLSMNDIMSVHMRLKDRWINTKISNDREVYFTDSTMEKISLSEARSRFEKFMKTYFSGIYFI